MGQAKRQMEKEEGMADVAIEIAIRGGALERCEFHDDEIIATGEEFEQSYKIAAAMIRDKDELVQDFENLRELTDLIKSVVEQAPDSCYCCDKWERED